MEDSIMPATLVQPTVLEPPFNQCGCVTARNRLADSLAGLTRLLSAIVAAGSGLALEIALKDRILT